jgi:hypothetical protein
MPPERTAHFPAFCCERLAAARSRPGRVVAPGGLCLFCGSRIPEEVLYPVDEEGRASLVSFADVRGRCRGCNAPAIDFHHGPYFQWHEWYCSNLVCPNNPASPWGGRRTLLAYREVPDWVDFEAPEPVGCS